jgi:hypothetical protein
MAARSALDEWMEESRRRLRNYPLPKLPNENIALRVLKSLGLVVGGLVLSLFGFMTLLLLGSNQLVMGLNAIKLGVIMWWSQRIHIATAAGILKKEQRYADAATCFAHSYSYEYATMMDAEHGSAYALLQDDNAIAAIPDDLRNVLVELLFCRMWLLITFYRSTLGSDENVAKTKSRMSALANDSEQFLVLVSRISDHLQHLARMNQEATIHKVTTELEEILTKHPKCMRIIGEHKNQSGLTQSGSEEVR